MKITGTTVVFEFLLMGVIPLEVEASITWGYPAKINDIPENCYPAEDDEVEINSVKFDGADFDIDDIYVGTGKRQMWLGEIMDEAAIVEALTDV
jgi:hypothetical protein